MTTTEESAAMTEASGLTGDGDRIEYAAKGVRDMMELPDEGRGFSEVLRRITIEAPLQSLAIAFLLGILIARRR
jgi:hypothetical protein